MHQRVGFTVKHTYLWLPVKEQNQKLIVAFNDCFNDEAGLQGLIFSTDFFLHVQTVVLIFCPIDLFI